MKKRSLKTLQLSKKSISNLANQPTGGRGITGYVCPTKAADRPGCPTYTTITFEKE